MVDMEVRKRVVQGEGKVEDTTMVATDSHSFKSTNLKRPTWCDHCGKLIWGLYNQGEKCGECGIKIHHKCHHSVSDCCGKPPKGTFYSKSPGALVFVDQWCVSSTTFSWEFALHSMQQSSKPDLIQWNVLSCGLHCERRCSFSGTDTKTGYLIKPLAWLCVVSTQTLLQLLFFGGWMDICPSLWKSSCVCMLP